MLLQCSIYWQCVPNNPISLIYCVLNLMKSFYLNISSKQLSEIVNDLKTGLMNIHVKLFY